MPSPTGPADPSRRFVQQTLADIGQPLSDVTFVVVDLETTGGAPEDAGITEFGAVKVRGGERLGEFSTLVDPGGPVPPYIAVLTGITDAMLVGAPRLAEALPAFLEFARGAVLVAHNAPYDVGFLKAACALHGYSWPGFPVLDTVTLARRALVRDEVPNCKLSTLAAHFRTAVEPCHRALDDARATVEVLHALLERAGGYRVHTWPDLVEFCRAVSPAQRTKKHLADGLPHVPGVYVFRDAKERPLYVGTSVDVATRVRGYFTAAETRARMSEMITIAERVEAIECAHPLEAEVRELRLIAAHKPPYNRRSKFPERHWFLKLTPEPYPRLSMVREARDDGGTYLGPFASRRVAEQAAAGVYDAVPLRQCAGRLSATKPSASCALHEIGRCPAPCELKITVPEYDVHAAAFRDAVHGDPAVVVERLLARITGLAAEQRYEEAAAVRGRLVAVLRAAVRLQRLRSLTSIPELVAAKRAGGGGWELAVVRHGRLVAAGAAAVGVHPMPVVESLLASAETVRPGPGPTPCASAEESERILAFLEKPDTRLVSVSDGGWFLPAAGAGRWRDLLERAEAARQAVGGEIVTSAKENPERHRGFGGSLVSVSTG